MRLRESVAKVAPRLLVLDPFVRLNRIDENAAGQVSALLGYLRELQREHDDAVLVVHHARKNGSAGQPGRSLRGSGDLCALGFEHRSKRLQPELVHQGQKVAADQPGEIRSGLKRSLAGHAFTPRVGRLYQRGTGASVRQAGGERTAERWLGHRVLLPASGTRARTGHAVTRPFVLNGLLAR
jgi:hypothetical protein